MSPHTAHHTIERTRRSGTESSAELNDIFRSVQTPTYLHRTGVNNGLEILRQAQSILNGLEHKDNYAWDSVLGFLVNVPDEQAEQYYTRESSGSIKRELERGADDDDDDYSWWLAQALHYGIRPNMEKDKIKSDLADKLITDGGHLKVPMRLLSHEQLLKDQVESAALLEDEIKEEEESQEESVENDHRRFGEVVRQEQVTNTGKGPESHRGSSDRTVHSAYYKPPAGGTGSEHGTQHLPYEDSGDEVDEEDSLEIVHVTPKSSRGAKSRDQTQTRQDRLIQRSCETTATAPTPFTLQTRSPQPQELFEIVVPSKLLDAASYETAPSSRALSRTSHNLNRPRSSSETLQDGSNMGAGLSHETSDDDEENLIGNLENHPPNPAKAQDETGGTIENELLADDLDEEQEFQVPIELSKNSAKIGSRPRITTDSGEGHTWAEYLKHYPQQRHSRFICPVGWRPDPTRYPESAYILREIRHRLPRGLYRDIDIEFCIELAAGDPDLSYWNFVDASKVQDVDYQSMDSYKRWKPNYVNPETQTSFSRLPQPALHSTTSTGSGLPQYPANNDLPIGASTASRGQFGISNVPSLGGHASTAVVKVSSTSQSRQLTYPKLSHSSSPFLPPLNPNACAKTGFDLSHVRPWVPSDQMDKGVLYHEKDPSQGYCVRTHDTFIQNVFPLDALASGLKKLTEEERSRKAFGLLVPRRDGYEARARRGKMLRDFVGKNSAADLGVIGESPSAMPCGRLQGNVSYEGHTNIPWQVEAIRKATEELNQAKAPTQLGPGSGNAEDYEVSSSETPRQTKQMDSLSEPSTNTTLPNHLKEAKRKRATRGTTGTNEHDNSMSAFRKNVKKRKTLSGTNVQQPSLPTEGPISTDPPAGSSSISPSARASDHKAAGASQKSAADNKPASTHPRTNQGSFTAGVGNANSGDRSYSLSTSNSTGTSEWECHWVNCVNKYQTVQELYDHVRIVHVGYESNGNVNMQCAWGECRSKLSYPSTAVRHILLHVPYRPFVCMKCDKAYSTRARLIQHVDVHDVDTGQTAGDASAPTTTPRLSTNAESARSWDDSAAHPSTQAEARGGGDTEASQVENDSTGKNSNGKDDGKALTGDAFAASRDGDKTEPQQHQDVPTSSPSIKMPFPTGLLPNKGQDKIYHSIDEESELARWESKVLRHQGTSNERKLATATKKRDKWQTAIEGIRAGTAESAAEAQLRLAREQKQNLAAQLQGSGNDGAESLMTELAKVKAKVKLARKDVRRKSASHTE